MGAVRIRHRRDFNTANDDVVALRRCLIGCRVVVAVWRSVDTGGELAVWRQCVRRRVGIRRIARDRRWTIGIRWQCLRRRRRSGLRRRKVVGVDNERVWWWWIFGVSSLLLPD